MDEEHEGQKIVINLMLVFVNLDLAENDIDAWGFSSKYSLERRLDEFVINNKRV